MRPGFLCSSALRGMWRAIGLTATSTATLAVGLWLMGLAAMLLLGGREAVHAWGTGGHITCGIAGRVPERDWPQVAAQVAALPGVESVAIISPAQSLQALIDSSVDHNLSAGISAALLPASLRIVPAAWLLDASATRALAARIGAIAGLEDIDYGAAPVAALSHALRSATLWALGLTVALALALTFMVMTTIRLMLYGRRDELQILQLIGATPHFVRAPFLLEGVLWGLAAGLLAGGVALCCDRLLAGALAHAAELVGLGAPLRLWSWPLLAAQLLLGATLGLLGSLLAVHAFVRDDLQSEL